MLWLYNPPEPCAWATHPFGLLRDGYGTGQVNAVPYHLQLHCEASGPLPFYPEACGSFMLTRANYVNFDRPLKSSAEGGSVYAIWQSKPTAPYGWIWQHSLRSLTVEQENFAAILGLAWWTWFGPFSGVDGYFPPVYRPAEGLEGGYQPLRGERMPRFDYATGQTELDDMPSSVLVLPWFP